MLYIQFANQKSGHLDASMLEPHSAISKVIDPCENIAI